MTPQLRRYVERIDALSLRERVLIFIAAALVLIAFAYLGFIAPLMERDKRLGREVGRRQTELAMLQAQLQAMARSSEMRPDEVNRAKLAGLQHQLAQLDKQIDEAASRFTSPRHMRDVLQEILARNPRLQLVDLKTLPVDLFGNSDTRGPRPIYRHALELTVSGAYLDLYAYLRQLEGLPTRLYWRKADLAAGDYPKVVLRLTVYTLSFDPSWMSV
ncbi:MAG TPA: type II secretion system protein GspM [Burkholderiales bacterium]|nr:type II secretion system protein GspM [Burkholderiales bacterium]